MKLDDRPVIDQLLDPTPLNHLYEVQDEMDAWLDTVSQPTAWVAGAEQMMKHFVAALEARL